MIAIKNMCLGTIRSYYCP